MIKTIAELGLLIIDARNARQNLSSIKALFHFIVADINRQNG